MSQKHCQGNYEKISLDVAKRTGNIFRGEHIQICLPTWEYFPKIRSMVDSHFRASVF